MSYPIDILPKAGYKIIDCNLAEHYLIRHTESTNIDELWDGELNCLKGGLIANQSKHIVDISTSLLSLFKGEFTAIELTDTGNNKYSPYCLPDENVSAPTHNEDYIYNENRCYWCIQIGKIDGKKVSYLKGVDPLEAECKVVHTPAKWNVWHFSIRWNTHEGYIHENPAALNRNWVRKLAHSAIVLIQEHAIFAEPISKSIDKKCYATS